MLAVACRTETSGSGEVQACDRPVEQESLQYLPYNNLSPILSPHKPALSSSGPLKLKAVHLFIIYVSQISQPLTPLTYYNPPLDRMGMSYRRYLSGERIYGCSTCKTHLATIHSMISRVWISSCQDINILTSTNTIGFQRSTRKSIPF
jgi:hypothetical protein